MTGKASHAEYAKAGQEWGPASIREANTTAADQLVRGEPVWEDVGPAEELLNDKGMHRAMILHAGPPILWDEMCGPMKGAAAGAVVFEGLAPNLERAYELLESGKVDLAPCHQLSTVGPMTGIVSASMPLMTVRNNAFGNRVYAALNEGSGPALRFGSNSPGVLRHLSWMKEILAPGLQCAVRQMEGLSLKPLMARALTMADELHMRNAAASQLIANVLLSELTEAGLPESHLSAIARFLTTQNDQFFLNFGMAAAKAMADAATVEGSTLVTCMARNGVEFGLQISGLPGRWFRGDATPPEGLYFPGYGPDDANPDLGDSAIMETVGVGAFAMATAPAIVRFLGAGRLADAVSYTEEMYRVTLAESPDFLLPNLDFRGAPTGIDAAQVLEVGIAPAINTAIAHKKPGIGMIGAGIARAPLAAFEAAILAFGEQYGLS